MTDRSILSRLEEHGHETPRVKLKGEAGAAPEGRLVLDVEIAVEPLQTDPDLVHRSIDHGIWKNSPPVHEPPVVQGLSGTLI